MGGGTFDVSSSAARAKLRHDTGTTAFTHDVDARAGRVAKLHESLDFTKKPQREARDNPDSPTSVPIGVLVDVTGSMSTLPELIIAELHKAVAAIKDKGVVEFPQILFGAIGDATSDEVPVQLGEFEASDELTEQHLSNIYLEGRGGGQNMESYELFLWMFANRIYTDAYEKRGEKGYLFIIGDEAPYKTVRNDLLRRYLGCYIDGRSIEEISVEEQSEANKLKNLSLEEIAEAVQQKWNVFCLRPAGSSNFNDDSVQKAWTDILPEERVLKVKDWKEIVPYIAATISVMAGMSLSDVVASLKDSGFDDATIGSLTNSLVPLEKTSLPVVMDNDTLAVAGVSADHGERL
jgi:hypothetical protein